jgi:glycerate kinase
LKIVIAPDSFKGSISAAEAASAIENGIKRYLPDAETVLIPVADGGEGTMDSLVLATNGHKVQVSVMGPLGQPVDAEYGWIGDGKTCVIEMASASGLCLVPSELRNPMLATTFGTGQLIRYALDEGCRQFILAIGGSATNDAGSGMLQALGLKLLDLTGRSVELGGGELGRITSLDSTEWDPRIVQSTFLIASDVQNPLVGIHGASHVFGPQKGADAEMVQILDNYLGTWADLVETNTGVRLHDRPGAGAAGGLGGAFQAFFPSEMKRGIDVVIQYTGLRKALQDADLVFTGEGQVDFQTTSGKTPMGVAQEAQRLGIPTIVLAGSIGQGIEALYKYGITSIHSIVNGPMILREAMNNSAELLAQKAEQIVRTIWVDKQ